MGSFSIQTRNPLDPNGLKIDAHIPGDLITRYYKLEPVKYQNFRAVKRVLEDPARIFNGIREFNKGGWCYVGCITEWCVCERVTGPFPPGYVFAVYLNPAMYVYDFRAELADPHDPLSPKGWEERYGGVAWKHSTS